MNGSRKIVGLNSVRREIVSYVTIVFYDKVREVRGRNKAQRWLLLVCCGFFIWKRYNRTHFHRTILWLTKTPEAVGQLLSYCVFYKLFNKLKYYNNSSRKPKSILHTAVEKNLTLISSVRTGQFCNLTSTLSLSGSLHSYKIRVNDL